MYEKKINIFNDLDRRLYNTSFKYNIFFLGMILIIIFSLILWKKDYYYQNIISFIDNKKAIIMVNKDKLDIINNSSDIILNNASFKYNIDKIEEDEKGYYVNIIFNNELNIKANTYKIKQGKESLLNYIYRVMKGD